MAPKALILVLVAGMLLTGCSNTLLTKYQDKQCVRNCTDADPERHEHFEQPVIQTLQMFVGEMGCWVVLGAFRLFQGLQKRRRNDSGYEPVANAEPLEDPAEPSSPILKALSAKPERPLLNGVRILLLSLPAICDICGTTLMNVGLLFVAASIYQMTRGALVLFVGLFSVIFLKRHLYLFHWLSLFIVVSGVAVVGLAGALFEDTSSSKDDDASQAGIEASVLRTVIGVLLIAGAQIFTATQFVLEEYILENYAMEPLQVVGWEGIFGFVVTLIAMIILHFTIGVTDAGKFGYFDAAEGLRELRNPTVAVTSFLIMVSIGAFNFFGISVTRTVSATSRSTIDTCRTLFIWVVSLGLGWEKFIPLQLVGFGLLVYGTFLFNEIINPPLKACMPARSEDVREELLPEDPIEHM